MHSPFHVRLKGVLSQLIKLECKSPGSAFRLRRCRKIFLPNPDPYLAVGVCWCGALFSWWGSWRCSPSPSWGWRSPRRRRRPRPRDRWPVAASTWPRTENCCRWPRPGSSSDYQPGKKGRERAKSLELISKDWGRVYIWLLSKSSSYYCYTMTREIWRMANNLIEEGRRAIYANKCQMMAWGIVRHSSSM